MARAIVNSEWVGSGEGGETIHPLIADVYALNGWSDPEAGERVAGETYPVDITCNKPMLDEISADSRFSVVEVIDPEDPEEE